MKRVIFPLYAGLALTLFTILEGAGQPLSNSTKGEKDTITVNKGNFQGNIRTYFTATDN